MCIRDRITDDPEDNKILECSQEADADFIVTGDNHLLKLRAVSYTHLRAHETVLDLVCRLLLEKKKTL